MADPLELGFKTVLSALMIFGLLVLPGMVGSLIYEVFCGYGGLLPKSLRGACPDGRWDAFIWTTGILVGLFAVGWLFGKLGARR